VRDSPRRAEENSLNPEWDKSKIRERKTSNRDQFRLRRISKKTLNVYNKKRRRIYRTVLTLDSPLPGVEGKKRKKLVAEKKAPPL